MPTAAIGSGSARGAVVAQEAIVTQNSHQADGEPLRLLARQLLVDPVDHHQAERQPGAPRAGTGRGPRREAGADEEVGEEAPGEEDPAVDDGDVLTCSARVISTAVNPAVTRSETGRSPSSSRDRATSAPRGQLWRGQIAPARAGRTRSAGVASLAQAVVEDRVAAVGGRSTPRDGAVTSCRQLDAERTARRGGRGTGVTRPRSFGPRSRPGASRTSSAASERAARARRAPRPPAPGLIRAGGRGARAGGGRCSSAGRRAPPAARWGLGDLGSAVRASAESAPAPTSPRCAIAARTSRVAARLGLASPQRVRPRRAPHLQSEQHDGDVVAPAALVGRVDQASAAAEERPRAGSRHLLLADHAGEPVGADEVDVAGPPGG